MKRYCKMAALFLALAIVLSLIPMTAMGSVTAPASSADYLKSTYDAMEATLNGTVFGSTLDDFTGTGYVDGLPDGASITFLVDAYAAGDYGVTLRYTNGTGETKNVNVYVNGEKVRTSSLVRTVNGTTWNTKLENLPLNEGVNTITYKNDEENNCDEIRFDKIVLARFYEAADAVLSGNGVSLNPSGYTGYIGKGCVGAFTTSRSGRVLFTVDAPEAGEYTMVMRYCASQADNTSRSFSLYINDVKTKQCRVDPLRNDASGSVWYDFKTTVTLNKGQNTIDMRRDGSGGGFTTDNGVFAINYITLKPVQWTYAGAVTAVDGNGTKQLTFTLDNAVVRITSVGKNAVKVWLEPTGLFSRKYESFTVVNEEVDPQSLNAADKGDYYEIDTGDMIMKIQKNPFKITYLDKLGNVLMENENASMGWTTDGELIVNSKLPEDEQFWGLGEKLGAFNYRGTRQINYSTDGTASDSSTPTTAEGRYYMSNPYFLSSKGYSILFDNTSRTVFDFGKADPNTTFFGSLNPEPGGDMIYYFTYGPDLKKVSKTFTDIVGKSFFAPIWGYGNAQSHWGYTQADIERVAQTYRDKEIPLDIMFGDIEWYGTYCTPTSWNLNNFPDPDGMFAKLKDLNLHFAIIDDPNINNSNNNNNSEVGPGPDFIEADTKGYFVTDHSGQTSLVSWPWGGDSGLVDFFNPEVREWWGDLHDMILEQGVEAFWLDCNEPCRHNTNWLFWNKDGKAYGTLSEVKNAYALMQNQAMFEKLHENGKRTLMLTRSTFTGGHRYISPWTGDINGTYTGSYSGLSDQIKLGMNLSLTGYNYWGFDIGGFQNDIDSKTYKRWVELACFTPIHRFHYAFYVNNKEPYNFAEDTARFFINLRYRLKPYMYALTADNILGIGIEEGYGEGGTGIPYTRPMVMEYPNDANTWSMDTQFMAGPSFLVAPVIVNADVKQVYLPEGKWYDYFNAPVVFDGGQTITYNAPQDVLPLFVKEGSIIPMYPEMQYWDPNAVNRVTLDVYPTFSDGDFNFVLYEDDGETDAYLDGAYTTTDYNCNVSIDESKTTYTLDIGTRTGPYTDIAPRDYLLQFHRGAMKRLSVKLGDTALKATASLEALEASDTGYFVDASSDICYVKIPDSGNAVTVTVTGEEVSTEIAMLVETLVANYKANIPVQVTTSASGAVNVRFVDSANKVFGQADAGTDGKAVIKVSELIPAGDYKIIASVDGEDIGDLIIVVETEPENIWKPFFGSDEGGTLLITFGAPITFKGPVTVNNELAAAELVGVNALALIGVNSDATGTIVVKGIKYPRLFPSYSFTFTLTK